MTTNIIKLKFLRYGEPAGREYTYFTPAPVKVDDLVELEGKQGIVQGVVTAINVPEEEIAPFKDRPKTIIGKMPQETKAELKAQPIHCGQYKPYGDFFRVWDIETDCEDKGKVLEYCFTSLYQSRIPESDEWHKNIRYGTGEKSGDANYYFAGYYNLNKTATGYKFTVCEPFTD
jgi:hypothetical protein